MRRDQDDFKRGTAALPVLHLLQTEAPCRIPFRFRRRLENTDLCEGGPHDGI